MDIIISAKFSASEFDFDIGRTSYHDYFTELYIYMVRVKKPLQAGLHANRDVFQAEKYFKGETKKSLSDVCGSMRLPYPRLRWVWWRVVHEGIHNA
jgi:hypothetical protein